MEERGFECRLHSHLFDLCTVWHALSVYGMDWVRSKELDQRKKEYSH